MFLSFEAGVPNLPRTLHILSGTAHHVQETSRTWQHSQSARRCAFAARRPSDGCAGFEDAGGIRASSAQGPPQCPHRIYSSWQTSQVATDAMKCLTGGMERSVLGSESSDATQLCPFYAILRFSQLRLSG